MHSQPPFQITVVRKPKLRDSPRWTSRAHAFLREWCYLEAADRSLASSCAIPPPTGTSARRAARETLQLPYKRDLPRLDTAIYSSARNNLTMLS